MDEGIPVMRYCSTQLCDYTMISKKSVLIDLRDPSSNLPASAHSARACVVCVCVCNDNNNNNNIHTLPRAVHGRHATGKPTCSRNTCTSRASLPPLSTVRLSTCALHPASSTLRPTPYMLHPTPFAATFIRAPQIHLFTQTHTHPRPLSTLPLPFCHPSPTPPSHLDLLNWR